MNEKYYDTEAYLKQFTPEQYLEAFMNMLRSYDIKMIPLNMMRTGFELAQPEGWRMVAPFWMEQFETEDIKPLEAFKDEST